MVGRAQFQLHSVVLRNVELFQYKFLEDRMEAVLALYVSLLFGNLNTLFVLYSRTTGIPYLMWRQNHTGRKQGEKVGQWDWERKPSMRTL